MAKEFKKRLTTSIILTLLTIFSIFLNQVVFLFSLLVVVGISFYEISEMIKKIFKTVKNIRYFLYNLLAIYYGLIIFIPTAMILHSPYTNLNTNISIGSVFFLFILLICIFSDTGGYVIGKSIGGKKLSNISPNKTISGSVGSFFFSLFPLFIFNYFNANEYFINLENIFFSLQISLICQAGDLFISYIKRKANVKDTGNILPGHGGILDRVDGIIFAIPFAWLLLSY